MVQVAEAIEMEDVISVAAIIVVEEEISAEDRAKATVMVHQSKRDIV